MAVLLLEASLLSAAPALRSTLAQATLDREALELYRAPFHLGGVSNSTRAAGGRSIREEFELIPVLQADASSLAGLLNQLFSAPSRRTSENPPIILAVVGSNTLLIRGRRDDIERIRRLVQELDTAAAREIRISVYFIEHSKAAELAATLSALYAQPTALAVGPAGSDLGGESSRAPGEPERRSINAPIRITPDEASNAVIIKAPPERLAEVVATAKELDRIPPQVLLEVMLAEIRLTNETQFGIDWAAVKGRLTFSTQNFPLDTVALIAGASNQRQGQPGVTGPGLTGVVFPTSSVLTLFNAFATANRLTIVSAPRIVASENRQAVLNVSESIPVVITAPVVTGTQGLPSLVTTQSVEYRDVGIIVKVTPRIAGRKTVAVEVKQEVNDIGPPTPPVGVPGIVKREVTTSAVLTPDQTLLLGGLIQDRRSNTVRGVPALKDVPLLGRLFRFTDDTVASIELIILVTPRLLQ